MDEEHSGMRVEMMMGFPGIGCYSRKQDLDMKRVFKDKVKDKDKGQYLTLGATVVNPLAGGAHEVGQGSAGSALAVA